MTRGRQARLCKSFGLLWLVFLALAAHPASAVLKRYGVRYTSLYQPGADLVPVPGVGAAVIDDDGGSGSPRLSRLAVVTDFEGTFFADCCIFIFFSYNATEGPAPDHVGTGSPASSIAWGTVTGWTITGSIFCHASFASLCTGANGADLATVDPPLRSPFYDLGTWTFHGTGFTATPFVHHLNNPLTGGNVQWILRGRLLAGFVPALPLAGLTVLGGILLVAGVTRLRRAKHEP